MKKNVASQSVGIQMITISDGSNFTGTVTLEITKDNGTQTGSAGTAPAHEGNGYHSYSPTQAETDADHIAFTFSGTGAITSSVQVFTSFPQTVDNDVILQTLPIATDIVSSGAITTSGGAVSTVTTVGTTTTNTDMRGTDSGFLAASAPTNFSALGISVGGAIDDVVLVATTTTNTDMVGTDNAATSAKQDTMETTLNAIPTTPMRGTDGANTLAPDNTSITAILVDTGTTLPDQITGLNNISTADILSSGDIDGFSIEESLKLIGSSSYGKLAGAATTTVTIQAADDSKARITATVDSDGNRDAVTLDASG